jgi:hypothetical protein
VIPAALFLLTSLFCQDEPIPFEAARSAFAEARACSERDAGRLWGLPLDGPLLFADRATRVVVANQADADGELGEVDGVWVGLLPDEVGIANTAVVWSGVEWTMVAWPLPVDDVARRKLLAHECYHRIQDERGLPGRDAAAPHLDEELGRAWLRCEATALATALRADAEARRVAVADALLFRAARHARFPAAGESERVLELNEGLAEYTGWAVCGLAAERLPEAVASALEQRLAPDNLFARAFPYVTGPAYAVLLDALSPGWPATLDRDSDLTAVLARAIAWRAPEDVEAAARAAAARHDGERLFREEAAREEVRRQRLAHYRERFVDGPVLVLAPGGEFQFVFDPNGVEALEDLGSVYLTLRAVDQWGILEVDAGGALVRREGDGITGVVVPAPADPPDSTGRSIQGDGWTLELAEGWALGPGARPGDLVPSRSP